MQKRIYHGSDHVIEKPHYGFGKPYNDYGLGFYCTADRDMAMEWAVSRDRDGFANAYDIAMDGLSVLDLGSEEYCILHWLAILLQNREFDIPSGLALEAREYITTTFATDYRSYDIIEGYRADDSYFSFAQDFINGTIALRQLDRAMHLGKLGRQFVLVSRRAFDSVVFAGAEPARSVDWFARKQRRDRQARREYLDSERNRRARGDLYIAQIIDEGMDGNDPRLRQGLSR